MKWLLVCLAMVGACLGISCTDDPPAPTQLACNETRDCPGGQRCACAGFCYTPATCETDSDCCADEICQDDHCTSANQCDVDADCSGGLVCTQCACLPRGCARDGDCAEGEVCDGGVCFDQGVAPCGGCAQGTACDPLANRCLPTPASCAAVECAPGETVTIAEIAAHLGPVCAIDPTCYCAEARPVVTGRIGTEFSALHVRLTEFVVAAHDHLYGDLVFYRFDGDAEPVDVEYIDGVPEVGPTGDPAGPRGGVSDPGRAVGAAPSMAWLSDSIAGDLGISYRDDTVGGLRFARRRGDGSWEVSTVDPVGDSGRASSLVVTRDGRWAVAYSFRDFGRSSLRVAVSDGDAPFGPTDWTFNDVDTREADPLAVEDVPPATGLTPDAVILGSRLYVAYHDGIDGNLELAFGDPGGPLESVILDEGDTRSKITGAGNVGLYPALAATPDGDLAVAYLDRVSGQIWYAVVDPTPADGTSVAIIGEPEEIDPGRQASPPVLVGPDLSLVFRTGGVPMVAYQDASNGDLSVAIQRDGAWERTTAARAGMSGFSPHLYPDLQGATWVLQGSLVGTGDTLEERIDARPTPF